MLHYIEGTVKHVSSNKVVVMTNAGVGYEIAVSSSFTASITEGTDIHLWLKTYVREDHFEIYGMRDRDELYVFELLVTVSGVGPKMALGVLERYSVDEIKSAILREDVSAFTSVSGIGKKNAARIILELKPKLSTEDARLAGLTNKNDIQELESALRQLGYRPKEIATMIQNIPENLTLDEQIKRALTT